MCRAGMPLPAAPAALSRAGLLLACLPLLPLLTPPCPPFPLQAMPINGLFMRRCKQGVLQFVLLKPVLAITCLWLEAADLYGDGDFRADRGYMWITIVYNFSYMFALFELLLFYVGTHEMMEPFRPLFKFIVVKSVIFLTFWQSICTSLMVSWAWIPTPEDGKAVQNFIICIEMAIFSYMMYVAFPYQDYVKKAFDVRDEMTLGANIGHAMSMNDVAVDTVHQFTTKYNRRVTCCTQEGERLGKFTTNYNRRVTTGE